MIRASRSDSSKPPIITVAARLALHATHSWTSSQRRFSIACIAGSAASGAKFGGVSIVAVVPDGIAEGARAIRLRTLTSLCFARNRASKYVDLAARRAVEFMTA